MIDPNKKEPLPVKPSDVCMRAFELMATKQFSDAEKLLSGVMARTDDNTAIALYHSTLGVLYKIQGEYKTAWQHYQRAERLLPDDPALKIISARLLIEQFAEYAKAIKKAKRVLEIIPGNPVFAHQAYTTLGLAYCKKGERAKTIEMLKASWGNDFRGFISAKNIDFTLVELLLKKGWDISSCKAFFDKAKAFADATGEDQYINLLNRMIAAFETEYPAENARPSASAEVPGQ